MQNFELLNFLKKHFSNSELQEMCLVLGVEYEDLAGTSRADKARELIIYLDHRGRVAELVAECQRLRPQAFGLSSSGKEPATKSAKIVKAKPLQVFCCYARSDQSYLYKLKNHLMALQRENLIEIKADIDIKPGTMWEQTIHHHLEAAQIILLLISADFIASDYCYQNEMQQAIARHKQGTARVVPIIIRPTSWQGTLLGQLQGLPKDAKPISSWENEDEAFLSITEGIHSIVQELADGFGQASTGI